MIENRFVISEQTFIPPEDWDRDVLLTLRPQIANQSLPIWVGIDASYKHDSTAIVAVTYDTKAKQVILVTHKVFQPSPEDPLNFEQTVEAAVLDLNARFRIQQVLFDPYQMIGSSQRLAAAGVKVEEFAQTQSNMTAASQQLYDLIKDGNIVLYPDAAMRLAMTRTIAKETQRGWRITKEKASHKIDVMVALALAAYAAVKAQAGPIFDFEHPFGSRTDWEADHGIKQPQPEPASPTNGNGSQKYPTYQEQQRWAAEDAERRRVEAEENKSYQAQKLYMKIIGY